MSEGKLLMESIHHKSEGIGYITNVTLDNDESILVEVSYQNRKVVRYRLPDEFQTNERFSTNSETILKYIEYGNSFLFDKYVNYEGDIIIERIPISNNLHVPLKVCPVCNQELSADKRKVTLRQKYYPQNINISELDLCMKCNIVYTSADHIIKVLEGYSNDAYIYAATIERIIGKAEDANVKGSLIRGYLRGNVRALNEYKIRSWEIESSHITFNEINGKDINHKTLFNPILYIHKSNNISCKRNNHPIESITAIIKDRNGNEVSVNANYCSKCDEAFMRYSEYDYYQKIFDLDDIYFESLSFDNYESNLSSTSPLSSCGYTTGKSVDLQPWERQDILRYIIELKILSKYQVMDYLQQFIDYNGRKSNTSEAVRKWKSDLDWVRNYNFHLQEKVRLEAIRNRKVREYVKRFKPWILID